MRVRAPLAAPALESAVAVGLAVAAAAVALIATAPHGPRVSTDSAYYLSAADSLRAGKDLVTFDAVPLTHWAPGFPIALAALGGVAGSTLDAARILNALCLAAVVVLGWALLSRVVSSRALRLVGVAGIAAAPTLSTVSVAAWSEPLFIALVLAAVLALLVALEAGRGWGWVALAGFLAGSSVAVRYSGTWLVASAVAILVLANRGLIDRGVRIRRVGLFVLAASIVPAVVVERNLRLTGNQPFGFRGESQMSVGQALSDTATGIWRWLVPEGATSAVRAVLIAALALIAAVGLIGMRRRPAGATSSGVAAATRPPAGRRAPLWPLALIVVAYVAFLAVAAATQSLDPIDRRLLSPMFVIGVVLAFGVIARAAGGVARNRALIAVGAVGGCAWLVAAVQTTATDVKVIRRHGAGFAETQYRKSPLVALIRRRRPSLRFSDAPDAIYLLTRARSSCWPTPGPTVCNGWPLHPYQVSTTRPSYIAWLAVPGAARPAVPPVLGGRFELAPIATVSDGGLYVVRARDRGSASSK